MLNVAENRKNIDGLCLKLIAVITMLIDHISAVIIKGLAKEHGGAHLFDFSSDWSIAYNIGRFIGRMAFPIFVFLLVEGYYHTSNKIKYAIRLFIFAIVSEIPFDMAISGRYFYLQKNNVLWTLFLGLVAIIVIEKAEASFNIFQNKMLARDLLRILVAAVFMVIAFVGHTDYSYGGILVILVMYVYYNRPWLGYLLVTIILTCISSSEIFAVLMLPFIILYNGKRGYTAKWLKYAFYVFYPLHLFVIAVVANSMGI